MDREAVRHLAGTTAVAVAMLVPAAAHATTITVDTNSGAGVDGSCALEDAIKAANKDKKVHECKKGNGADKIFFDLPGSTSIQPAQQLPDVTKPVTIDGTSQPGAGGEPGVTLDEGAVAVEGIEVTGKHVTIRGLIFSDFTFEAVRISGTDVHVVGNLIGVNLDGNSHPNGVGVSLETGGNVVGGASPSKRNVISGNNSVGINSAGDGNTITGNYIGTDKTGALPVPNGSDGVNVSSGTGTAVKLNLISGNNGTGVLVGSFAKRTILDGNYIGTDSAGGVDLGNDDAGVVVQGATHTLIGGSSGNLISGNGAEGIVLFNGAEAGHSVVQGNQIGTDATGLDAIPNSGPGIRISASQRNVIGGAKPAARNVISGNNEQGVFIGLGQDSDHNTVSGNFIGLGSDGVTQLGNGEAGVLIDQDGQNNLIGGNRIAWNATDGIEVTGATATGNSLLGNLLFEQGQAIDLGDDGLTFNDLGSPPDTDTGPNNRQNFPDLAGGNEQQDKIFGALASTPQTSFRIEFFISQDNGEAKKFVGAKTIKTDGAGHKNFAFKSTKPLHEGEFATATATRLAGKRTTDTSELSGSASISQGQ